MKLSLEINKKIPCPISKSFIEKVIIETIKLSDLSFLNKKNILISIAVISEREIKAINKKYRKNNSSTDILSFSEYKSIGVVRKNKDNHVFLGELMICCEYIRKSAKINKNTLNTEMAYILSHGVLHLLGFGHSRRMFFIQDKVVELLI